MILLHNANIITLDENKPRASAIVIDDGRIIGVGSDNEIRSGFEGRQRPGEALESQDLSGKTILPGLIDAHIHLELYALGLQKVDCETATRQECLSRVAQHARRGAPGEWILGHGWNQNNWPEGFGNAADLDAIAPAQAVYLTAKSLHASWGNSLALQRAGISASTPDPEGGKIGRNARGEPDGILYESAMGLLEKALPEATIETVSSALRKAQTVLWSMGLTGAHDFDGPRCFSALQQLRARGELKLRVVKGIPLYKMTQAVELGLRSGFGDDLLRIGSVKAFADGALGPQTAAMLQPYENSPTGETARGMLLMDAEELYETGRQAVKAGLSMAVHAIGDRANHAVLDGFEHLRRYEREELKVDAACFRHRIEHVQLIHPEDAGRLAQLGVIASMQPMHAPSDMLMADRYWGQRAALSYAWRTQLEAGAQLAFGSDAPVESPNPFWGLHAAVTRQRQDGSPGPQGWFPEQKLSLQEALEGFTSGPAYAAGMEDRLGKLAPGYLGDLIVLECDPFDCAPEELYTLHPSATMVGGEWVWGDKG